MKDEYQLRGKEKIPIIGATLHRRRLERLLESAPDSETKDIKAAYAASNNYHSGMGLAMIGAGFLIYNGLRPLFE